MDDRKLLREYIHELLEARIRETDITDGSRVPFGSAEHIADLEFRIADLERWRDRQRRGSEARANYARLITRLRGELRAATREASKNIELHEEDELHEAKVVHWEHTRGTGAACGKSVSGTARREDVTCAKCKKMIAKERVNESINNRDPEFASIEDFVQFMIEDERIEYSHEELSALNFRTHMPINSIRKELESYGMKLATRVPEKKVRGFNTSSNDRWFGPGSMATHGGAGIDPTTGRATARRGDV